MKRLILEFLRRGFAAWGFGPMVLAAVYLILYRTGAVQTLTVPQVCRGIFSLSALAFLAGGMNVVYQIERLPLMAAVTLHGVVLYAGYLLTYLLNGWLERGTAPILLFTAIFVVGYLAIWAVIYGITRRNTQKLNRALQQKQRRPGDA